VKKTYFFSDIHLGLPDSAKSRQREKLLVQCLNEIKSEAGAVYFAGDIFDFWWEYKHVVPRGFTRFLGKIAEFTDAGIPVHFFTGNHDIWMKNYLPEEVGIILHFNEFETQIGTKKFFITHGDGLGPGDRVYKILKKIFTNRPMQWLFSRLHPNLAFGIAKYWSLSRRKKEKEYRFAGRRKELLLLYADEILLKKNVDVFIFGHRHIPYLVQLSEKSVCANIGDWIINFTFLVFDENQISQKTYKNGKIEDFTANPETVYKLNVFG
jgi:UDP-2,3-diacylglucosamine hydrolase